MGKVRKPKNKKAVKELVEDRLSDSEEVPTDSREDAIQTIIDQLQASSIEEKCYGLQSLGIMIESSENIEQVFSSGVVKVVAPLLFETVSSVRMAAAGALRNLSALKPEACDVLMEQDVMTSLISYFHKYTENWIPDPSSKTHIDDSETFLHCLNLLINLCESSDLAIKYLGQSRILDILPQYLDRSVFTNDIVTVVLQTLFVVVEDNPLAMEKIKSNSERQLQALLSLEGDSSAICLVKTLAAGVIINTCGGNIATLPVDVINQIISILANTLSVDHRVVCSQLSSNVPLKDEAGKIELPKGKAALVLENEVKSVSQMLDAQQSAVEIIANICSCDEDEDNMNGNDSSESDNADDEISNNGDESLLAEDKLPPEVMEALISLAMFDKVWARTQMPAQNVVMILNEYEGSQIITKKLLSLQASALICVNNMLSTLPIENLGGVNGVYKIWVDAGKLVFKQDVNNMNILESATAVMRAALDKIKFRENGNTSGCSLFTDLALSDIEVMLTGIRECQVPEIRSNLIRMIGILALLLANNLNETTSSVICTITNFLLEQAHKENEVWVLAEAIDTVVDLYSGDDTDILAANVKLVDKLMILMPILRNKARQQKKLPKEYKALVNTATTNLPRFIKYMRDRIREL